MRICVAGSGFCGFTETVRLSRFTKRYKADRAPEFSAMPGIAWKTVPGCYGT